MAISLRNHWSTLILHISAYIARKKQSLLIIHGVKAFFSTFLIVGAEILLLFISLPSYLAVQPIGDQGQTQKYRLRRALTLSIIGTLFVIWVLKLALILTLSGYVKTQSPVTITETQNRPGNTQTYADDLLIAKENEALLPPTVTKIQNMRGQIAFWGTATANSIVVFSFTKASEKNVVPKIYSTQTDAKGNFELLEDATVFNLPNGNYQGTATTYDPVKETKSIKSHTFSFSVKEPLWNTFLHSVDTILNILALLAIVAGLLMTILVS